MQTGFAQNSGLPGIGTCDSRSILSDTDGCCQAGEMITQNASFAREYKVVKPAKHLSLLKRRRCAPELLLQIPCVEKQASPFTILSDRYRFIEKLGSGCSSVVHRAVTLDSSQAVALKMPREKDAAKAAIAEQEYKLLKRLAPHPNIIKALDFLNLQGEATLVLEFFDGVSLEAAVQKEIMPEPTARPLCMALFNAVAHLHGLNILHRDIKPHNVLISHCFRDLRLIDFNVATCVDDGALTPTGTHLYKAPELLRGGTSCKSTDVWASGLCIFFMVSAKLPYGRNLKCSGVVQEDSPGLDLFHGACWQHVAKQCKVMLQSCLDSNAELRPSMASLLEDAWFSDPLI